MKFVYPLMLAAVAAAWWYMGWGRVVCSHPPRYSWATGIDQWPCYVAAIGICAAWWHDMTKGQIRRWRETGCCAKCGYSLIGNVSGRCPECGEPLPSQR